MRRRQCGTAALGCGGRRRRPRDSRGRLSHMVKGRLSHMVIRASGTESVPYRHPERVTVRNTLAVAGDLFRT